MNYMFSLCSALKSLPLLDVSNVDDTSDMFRQCTCLAELGGFAGLRVNLDLHYCTYLTHDSLMNVINKAADVSDSRRILTLGNKNLSKLSFADKAIATGKGWTLQ